MDRLSIPLLLFLLKVLSVRCEPSVHILAENFGQLVTSTTLQWVPIGEVDEAAVKYAVKASTRYTDEPQPDHPEANNGLREVDVYICRAVLNAVWVSGQFQLKERVCVISSYRVVSRHVDFEVLISVEDSSRLSWAKKDKYQTVPQGAVTSGNGDMIFIGRRKEANETKAPGLLTYNVGKYVPDENLGMFHVVDSNYVEQQSEDGEILVETEPIRYEMKHLKYDRLHSRYPKQRTELGHAVLKNEDGGFQLAESVIGYQYQYYLNWGRGHGLLTGLPFSVILPNGTEVHGKWGIAVEKIIDSVAAVKKQLPEGTAVNVTLIGNYTKSEVPYVATVTCVYKDDVRRDIKIGDTKREYAMLDVTAVYGPVYFLHNNSFVPTTTTTTTTTTSTTTTRTTSTTIHVVPIASPRDENEIEPAPKTIQSDESNHRDAQPSSTNQDPKDPNSGSTSAVWNAILAVCLIVLRVT